MMVTTTRNKLRADPDHPAKTIQGELAIKRMGECVAELAAKVTVNAENQREVLGAIAEQNEESVDLLRKLSKGTKKWRMKIVSRDSDKRIAEVVITRE